VQQQRLFQPFLIDAMAADVALLLSIPRVSDSIESVLGLHPADRHTRTSCKDSAETTPGRESRGTICSIARFPAACGTPRRKRHSSICGASGSSRPWAPERRHCPRPLRAANRPIGRASTVRGAEWSSSAPSRVRCVDGRIRAGPRVKGSSRWQGGTPSSSESLFACSRTLSMFRESPPPIPAEWHSEPPRRRQASAAGWLPPTAPAKRTARSPQLWSTRTRKVQEL